MRSVCSLGSKDKMRFIEKNMAGDCRGMQFSITSLLENDEELLYETRRHWGVLIPYLLAALLLSRLTGGISLILILLPAFQIKTYDYAVTDRRILTRQGLFKRETISIPIDDIASAKIVPGPALEKIGMGTVLLETRTGDAALRHIEDAKAFLFYFHLEKTRGDSPFSA